MSFLPPLFPRRFIMKRTNAFSLAVAAMLLAPTIAAAQGDEKSRTVAGGGISVAGWQGKIDPKEVAAGMKLEDAKLSKVGNDLKVTTGPGVTYWNPANKATGNYTVKATFKEPSYMNVNNHAHPYGIVIGGNDMGTDQQTFLYCAAYGNGTFIVRGFGPAPFQLNGRGGADPASPDRLPLWPDCPRASARRGTAGGPAHTRAHPRPAAPTLPWR